MHLLKANRILWQLLVHLLLLGGAIHSEPLSVLALALLFCMYAFTNPGERLAKSAISPPSSLLRPLHLPPTSLRRPTGAQAHTHSTTSTSRVHPISTLLHPIPAVRGGLTGSPPTCPLAPSPSPPRTQSPKSDRAATPPRTPSAQDRCRGWRGGRRGRRRSA